MYTYYIGIGSNLGDRESYLSFAISELTVWLILAG